MENKNKSWIIWILFGVIAIGFLVGGIEINENSMYCNASQIPIVNGSGVWVCQDYVAGSNTTKNINTDDIIYDIRSSKYNKVVWDISDADADEIYIQTDPNTLVYYGGEIL